MWVKDFIWDSLGRLPPSQNDAFNMITRGSMDYAGCLKLSYVTVNQSRILQGYSCSFDHNRIGFYPHETKENHFNSLSKRSFTQERTPFDKHFPAFQFFSGNKHEDITKFFIISANCIVSFYIEEGPSQVRIPSAPSFSFWNLSADRGISDKLLFAFTDAVWLLGPLSRTCLNLI